MRTFVSLLRLIDPGLGTAFKPSAEGTSTANEVRQGPIAAIIDNLGLSVRPLNPKSRHAVERKRPQGHYCDEVRVSAESRLECISQQTPFSSGGISDEFRRSRLEDNPRDLRRVFDRRKVSCIFQRDQVRIGYKLQRPLAFVAM